MASETRLIASCVCFLVALALVPSASPAEPAPVADVDECWEGSFGKQGEGHDFFQGGACYQCAPNTCHTVTSQGYCHQYHFTAYGQCGAEE